MSREVPEGWKAVKIGDVLSIRRGVTWDKEAELPPGNGDAMPVISIPNIQDRLDLKHLRYIRKTSVSNIDKFIARSGWTLMVGSNGNPDRVGNCVLAANVDECLFASFLLGIYPVDTSCVLPEYGYRILSNQTVQDAISASVQGTTGLRNISVKMLRELEVSLPPLHEQRRIAEILSSVDDAIAATRAVIEQTKKVKQGVLERLLTKGIGHTRFKQTEIGEIPEGWEVCRLSTIASSIDSGWSPDCEKNPASEGEWGILKTSAVVWGGYQFKENKKLPDGFVPRPEIEVKTGDVLVTRAGPVDRTGVVALVKSTQKKLMLSDKIIRIQSRADKCVPDFLCLWLSSNSAQNEIVKKKSGMAMSQTNISQKALRDLFIAIPPVKEQTEISKAVQSVDESIEAECAKLEALILSKSALMSDLLTGRKRVPDALPLATQEDAA